MWAANPPISPPPLPNSLDPAGINDGLPSSSAAGWWSRPIHGGERASPLAPTGGQGREGLEGAVLLDPGVARGCRRGRRRQSWAAWGGGSGAGGAWGRPGGGGSGGSGAACPRGRPGAAEGEGAGVRGRPGGGEAGGSGAAGQGTQGASNGRATWQADGNEQRWRSIGERNNGGQGVAAKHLACLQGLARCHDDDGLSL